MLREIDQLRGFADAAQGRFGDGFGFAGERDHAAIVVGVAFAVEQETRPELRAWPRRLRRFWRRRALRRNSAHIRQVVS